MAAVACQKGSEEILAFLSRQSTVQQPKAALPVKAQAAPAAAAAAATPQSAVVPFPIAAAVKRAASHAPSGLQQPSPVDAALPHSPAVNSSDSPIQAYRRPESAADTAAQSASSQVTVSCSVQPMQRLQLMQQAEPRARPPAATPAAIHPPSLDC